MKLLSSYIITRLFPPRKNLITAIHPSYHGKYAAHNETVKCLSTYQDAQSSKNSTLLGRSYCNRVPRACHSVTPTRTGMQHVWNVLTTAQLRSVLILLSNQHGIQTYLHPREIFKTRNKG